MKIDKKIVFVILPLLIGVLFYSYLNSPQSFEFGGGSCYQGITVSVNKFVLKICGIVSLISIMMKNRLTRVLSILSLLIWSIWAILISKEYGINEFFYFFPLFLVELLIVFVNFKCNKIALH